MGLSPKNGMGYAVYRGMEPTHYTLKTPSGGTKGRYSTKKRATRAMDRADNAYGAYGHRVMAVYPDGKVLGLYQPHPG